MKFRVLIKSTALVATLCVSMTSWADTFSNGGFGIPEFGAFESPKVKLSDSLSIEQRGSFDAYRNQEFLNSPYAILVSTESENERIKLLF